MNVHRNSKHVSSKCGPQWGLTPEVSFEPKLMNSLGYFDINTHFLVYSTGLP